jgi:hypothetical protein
MSTQHTPTPWQFHYSSDANTLLPDLNALASAVAMQIGDGSDSQAEANAALIDRACNSHDALVAALRHAVAYCDITPDEHGLSDSLLAEMRAALAAAEVQP